MPRTQKTLSKPDMIKGTNVRSQTVISWLRSVEAVSREANKIAHDHDTTLVRSNCKAGTDKIVTRLLKCDDFYSSRSGLLDEHQLINIIFR